MKPPRFAKTPYFPPHTGALLIVRQMENEISQTSWQGPLGFAGLRQGKTLVFTTSGAVLPRMHSAARVPAKSEWTGLFCMVPHLYGVLRDALCDTQSHHSNCSGSGDFWQMMGTTRTSVL